MSIILTLFFLSVFFIFFSLRAPIFIGGGFVSKSLGFTCTYQDIDIFLSNLPYLLGKNEKFECASAFAKVRFEFDYQYLILVQLRQSQPSGYPSNFTVYNLWVGCKRTEIQVIDLC